MEGVSDRYAEFRCAIACAFPDNSEPIIVQGAVAGEITQEPSGNGGFGYDPVFYYPPDGMTLAELDAQRKNQISHRGAALTLFAAALVARLQKN